MTGPVTRGVLACYSDNGCPCLCVSRLMRMRIIDVSWEGRERDDRTTQFSVLIIILVVAAQFFADSTYGLLVVAGLTLSCLDEEPFQRELHRTALHYVPPCSRTYRRPRPGHYQSNRGQSDISMMSRHCHASRLAIDNFSTHCIY